jgi:glycosyltransferase involved in cell wall biosynthesis
MFTGRSLIGGSSGLESYVRAHAYAAAASGWEVHVFCLARRNADIVTEFGVVHEVRAPFGVIRAPLAGLCAAAFVRASKSRMPRGDGSGSGVIVHAFGAWAVPGVAVCRVLARRGTATVLVASAFTTLEHEFRAKLEGLRVRDGIWNALRYAGLYAATRLIGSRAERRAFASARVLLVNYQSVADLVVREYGEQPNLRRIAYASDAAFRLAPRPAATPPAIERLRDAGAPLVLCVSRHDPRKGVDVLLNALSELKAAGVPFRACLVGRGELLEVHRRLCTRFGLDADVAITGYVPEVEPYLREADIYVLPSREEGSGSVALLDALALGIAVVASRIDGVPEDVRDGHDALLVEPGDAAALAAAIRRLIEDAAMRRRLGAQAGVTHAAHFAAPPFVAALGAVYRELTAEF